MPGVRRVKAQLSAYLAEVQSGTEVVITDRGKAVARLVSVGTGIVPHERLIEHLAEEGLIDAPEGPRRQRWPSAAQLSPGIEASVLVRDDRR